MTKAEFGKISMAIKTYYPNANMLPNEKAFELWFHQLEDLPYQLASAALDKWVALNKWPPTIADIREGASEIAKGPSKPWGEAWGEVLEAVSRYGYIGELEALDSLDEVTRQTVRQIGFLNICMSENITADRANFRLIYEQLSERKKSENQMSPTIRNMIQNMTAQMIGMKDPQEQLKEDIERGFYKTEREEARRIAEEN